MDRPPEKQIVKMEVNIMLNRIILSGRLTRDPELRRTQSGIPVAS
ncbi:single-stranded DNA-binding protein, partial [Flavonifractor sp. An4]